MVTFKPSCRLPVETERALFRCAEERFKLTREQMLVPSPSHRNAWQRWVIAKAAMILGADQLGTALLMGRHPSTITYGIEKVDADETLTQDAILLVEDVKESFTYPAIEGPAGQAVRTYLEAVLDGRAVSPTMAAIGKRYLDEEPRMRESVLARLSPRRSAILQYVLTRRSR